MTGACDCKRAVSPCDCADIGAACPAGGLWHTADESHFCHPTGKDGRTVNVSAYRPGETEVGR